MAGKIILNIPDGKAGASTSSLIRSDKISYENFQEISSELKNKNLNYKIK